MTAAIIGLISALAGIVSVLLEVWVNNSPERKKEVADEERTRLRLAVRDGDADAVSGALDDLLCVTPTKAIPRPVSNGEAGAGTASTEQRVVDLGERADRIGGASGGV